jgi:CubicO group peptidase (beta-lactamase class C family)
MLEGFMRPVFAALAALAFLSLPGSAPASPTLPLPPPQELTAQDVGPFLDGFVPLALERGNIAGAVVVVVKDNRVLFEKGYGFSDIDKQIPVDPKTTLFRPGSISKLFTWTAVMQQVEQGKLDLDADVNTYLDFKIPPAFGKPVTLRNLMTHTPGFEETVKNLFVTDPKRMTALDAALKAWVPTRVFPPGQVPAYSNYGAALAGYIVQRVSGEPFEQYVARHILQPLGMAHATFVQPLPKALAADMSKGYDEASKKPQPFELIPMSPAGALSASGDDMARFMLAHLANGSFNGAQILKPETAIRMHGIAYQRIPPLPGMAYGFYHEDRNGHTIVGHGGDTLWFHSDLHLILDRNVGLFVSQNSAGKERSGIRSPLFKAFMDRYFPAPRLGLEPTLKSAKADGALAAGNYETSRNSFSNFMSIGNLLGQPKLNVNDDGTVSVDALTDFAGTPKKWREVKPFVWREVHGRELLMAERENGQVTEIATDAYPQVFTFRRAPFWQSQALNLPLFVGTLAMLALTVIFWPIKAILRWRYDRPFALTGRAAMLYRLTRVVALCDLALLGGILGFVGYAAATNHLDMLGSSYDWVYRILQAIGLIGVIGVFIPLLEVSEGIGDRARPWWTKLTDILVATACVLSVWYALSLHFLSWSLNY